MISISPDNLTDVVWSDGQHNVTVWVNDSAGNENSSSVTFLVDTTYPLIDYGTGTAVDYANLSQSNVYVNVTVTELNEANITFRLYNSTAEVNTTVFTDSTRTINWTSLPDEVYTYNVTVTDYSNSQNTTATRTIISVKAHSGRFNGSVTISTNSIMANPAAT